MYRYFNSKFWTDPFVEKLNPEQKIVYIYIFTSCPTQAGIYEISESRISNETGVPLHAVREALQLLEENQKIYRVDDYILIANFLKYQATRSPKILKRIEKELMEIAHKVKVIKIYKEKIWRLHMEFNKGVKFPVDLDKLEKLFGDETDVQCNIEKNEQTVQEEKLVTVKTTPNCPVEKIMEMWNQSIVDNKSELKPIKKISPGTERYRHLMARWRKLPDIKEWKKIIDNVTRSDFLNGRKPGKRGPFFASFDWLIGRDQIFIRAWEGQYNKDIKDIEQYDEMDLRIGKIGKRNVAVYELFINESVKGGKNVQQTTNSDSSNQCLEQNG